MEQSGRVKIKFQEIFSQDNLLTKFQKKEKRSSIQYLSVKMKLINKSFLSSY